MVLVVKKKKCDFISWLGEFQLISPVTGTHTSLAPLFKNFIDVNYSESPQSLSSQTSGKIKRIDGIPIL